MTIECKYIANDVGVIYTGKGILSAEDIIKADQNLLLNIEKLKTRKWTLVDFSEVDAVEISDEELIEIAEADKKIASAVGPNIIAIVANKDLMFGMSRVWEVFVEMEEIGWHTNVFRTRVEAESWLKNEAKALFKIDLTNHF